MRNFIIGRHYRDELIFYLSKFSENELLSENLGVDFLNRWLKYFINPRHQLFTTLKYFHFVF